MFALLRLAFPLLLFTVGADADDRLSQILLPEGFSIERYAFVHDARQMAWGEQGTLFVGSRSNGHVRAVTDEDGDGIAERVRVITPRLRMPSGIAFRDGSLYVAALSHIFRFDGIEDRLDDPPEPVIVTDALPTDRHHGWKVLSFGPDGRLYVPVGAPCNVCRTEGYHGTILRMQPDGSDIEIVAKGIRNSVGLGWHSETGELWFTDNGRDMLGDNLPPGEFNRMHKTGLHYGFPHCHAGDIPDPQFGDEASCSDFEPPAQPLGPHVAPLGFVIHSGRGLPDEYRGVAFIAEHGSWNRSQKIGYRISLVRLDTDGRRALGYEVFAEGWLQGESMWGRPSDVLEAPDGSLLVADDHADAIWRIRYVGN